MKQISYDFIEENKNFIIFEYTIGGEEYSRFQDAKGIITIDKKNNKIDATKPANCDVMIDILSKDVLKMIDLYLDIALDKKEIKKWKKNKKLILAQKKENEKISYYFCATRVMGDIVKRYNKKKPYKKKGFVINIP